MAPAAALCHCPALTWDPSLLPCPCHGVCAGLISPHLLPQGLLNLCAEIFPCWHAWSSPHSLSGLLVLPKSFPSSTSWAAVTVE